MTNNDVLKKLRVALKLRDDDIVKILELVDFRISKSELGAFFRKEDHPKYMECGDQILRNFLNGLVIHMRGPLPKKIASKTKVADKSSEKKVSTKKPDYKKSESIKPKSNKKASNK
ncbi:conserved hypothetical protein (DUF1456) [Formosa agariphila KMM 3901]|uniref:Uncharacterized protein n=1 Tax=Formosa agariphila (strain DSM 15362 / KCTC 12365 / LMG 23005 / KMM 3901 / M-2Alg 35-1) TaxID=1347342 RepID=T2KKB2_FORAG|nr:DUF1456 family protein [Formosa agariphila]CDF78454.1 conserved hypothetical protein (DUF1456) [Formosa agariphila KMM 3901]